MSACVVQVGMCAFVCLGCACVHVCICACVLVLRVCMCCACVHVWVITTSGLSPQAFCHTTSGLSQQGGGGRGLT